jgi:hypothetical protein
MEGPKFIWTEETINYVRENWGKIKAHSMKKVLGCSWYAVVNKAKELGFESPENSDWDDDDVLKLKELAEKYHYEDIAKMMNRTPNAIYLKARRLNIRLIQDRNKWIEEDEQMLRDYWGSTSIEKLAKKMKRSIFSLKVKAVRMGLGSMISNNLDEISINDISQMLGVGLDRIYTTWINKGLKIKNIKITKNMSYMAVTWGNLIDFLKENQDDWDSKDLDKNMLGLEPDWLKAKRIKDFNNAPLKYRKWTKEELVKIKSLLIAGKDYKYIAKEVKRSEWAVANMLRNEGMSFRLSKYWKGKEMIFLKENYKEKTQEEIANILGRTKKAIGAKAEELGIQKRKKY